MFVCLRTVLLSHRDSVSAIVAANTDAEKCQECMMLMKSSLLFLDGVTTLPRLPYTRMLVVTAWLHSLLFNSVI